MRDVFWLAVGVAATPAWLTWSLLGGTTAALAAAGWAVLRGGAR